MRETNDEQPTSHQAGSWPPGARMPPVGSGWHHTEAYRRSVDVEIAFAKDELVRRLEGAIDAFAVAWLEGHASGDDPAGILLERFGDVVAAATPARPDLDFMNRIHGLAVAVSAALAEVLSFYRSLGLRPWI
jgi:hypothetical protein